MVSAETRRGGDKWDFSLNDPLPEFRIRSAHLEGLRSATPRVKLSGPLLAGRLYPLEGSELLIDKAEVRTLPFPMNQIRSSAFNSFTQLDSILGPSQTLTTSLHFVPVRAALFGKGNRCGSGVGDLRGSYNSRNCSTGTHRCRRPLRCSSILSSFFIRYGVRQPD